MNQITTRDRTTADAAKTAAPETISPGTSQADAPAARAPGRRRGNYVRPVLMLGGIALVIVGTGYVWLTGGQTVSTDDSLCRGGGGECHHGCLRHRLQGAGS